MSTFSAIEIGKKLKCPWCGTKSLTKTDGDKTCKCCYCEREFRILIKDLPDPKLFSQTNQGKKHCGRKVQHESLQSAYTHCIEILPKDLPGREAKSLCVYKCMLGDHFHVGHKSKRKRYLMNETYTFIELRLMFDGVVK